MVEAMPVGGFALQKKPNTGGPYPAYTPCSCNRGWHGDWFNIRNPEAAPFPVFTGRRPEERESWSWGCGRKERHKVEAIEEELRKLMRHGLDGVRVFYTLYRRRIALLVERMQPMWEYGGQSDANRASSEELPEDEVWSHIGRVLQLRPWEMVAGKPIPLNASIASTLVRSLFCSCFFSALSYFFDLVHSFRRGLGGISPDRTYPRDRWAGPGRPPRRRRQTPGRRKEPRRFSRRNRRRRRSPGA